MRTRALIGAVGLVVVAMLSGCGDSGSDDNGGAGDQDGGSGETVSKQDWVRAADAACDTAKSAIADIPGSTALLASPQNDEQLMQAAEYLSSLADSLERLVEELDDMPQPETDADQANAVVDALGKALASLHTAHDAATAGDATTYAADFATFDQDFEAYTGAADAAGLTVCASQTVAD